MAGKQTEGLNEVPAEINWAVELALERKASGTVVLDLRGISTATDYFVIATGTSDVQVKAIAEHVRDELKKESVRPEHVEGLRGGRWVLMDYVDFVAQPASSSGQRVLSA